MRIGVLALQVVFIEHVEIVTIHPIEKQQIQNRVLSGRWIYE